METSDYRVGGKKGDDCHKDRRGKGRRLRHRFILKKRGVGNSYI